MIKHYISLYYHKVVRGKVDEPLVFWHKSIHYPTLASIAVDILSCPPSSAVVERVFSKAGIAVSGRRMNLSGKQLEREIMFQVNKTYH